MKRLKKGFTLIELLVVIAIIGILATTLAPKLREQLAKAKDAKAIAFLGTARTGASVLLVDKMVQDTAGAELKIKLSEIVTKLDDKTAKMVDTNGLVKIGGSRATTDGDVVYGNKVLIVASTSSSILTDYSVVGDDLKLNLTITGTGTTASKVLSTEGKAWLDY